MALYYQIPRNSLTWLLAAMFAGILPHALRLPWWISLLCLLCGLWRVQIYRQRAAFPNFWIRALIVLAGLGAVLGAYGTLLGPEAGSALLVLGFAFKLLEMKQRRDALVVVILAYFVVATQFLFEQGLVGTAYMIVVFFMVTAALAGLSQSPLRLHPGRTARLAGLMLLQSVPLMVVLFILVPRVPPLWNLDLGSKAGRTGLSESMTPGDIADLSRSPELAFRAEFEGAAPPASQLYWRGLVLSEFDGRSWTVARPLRPTSLKQGRVLPDWVAELEPRGEPLRYRVIQEPSNQPWLFALPLAYSREVEASLSDVYTLRRDEPLLQPYAHRVESYLQYRLSEVLDPRLRRHNLQLPAAGNPRARALAKELRARFDDDRALANAILARIRQEPYRYTLKPPVLGEESIDEFFFDTRAGFCAHYAGAFVFLLRAAGVPSRVVAGYQGGEYNALGNYVLVHQFDAHAWAEIWLPERGWTRVDPTEAVAPERVELGIEQALAEEASFLSDRVFSAARYRAVPWVNQVRLAWDFVQLSWYRAVLGYDEALQTRLLSQWLGQLTPLKIALALAAGLLLVLTVLGVVLFRRPAQPRVPEAVRLYRRFCRKMAQAGVERHAEEPPRDYLRRIERLRPDLTEAAQEIASLYEALSYARRPDAARLETLRRRVARFRP